MDGVSKGIGLATTTVVVALSLPAAANFTGADWLAMAFLLIPVALAFVAVYRIHRCVTKGGMTDWFWMLLALLFLAAYGFGLLGDDRGASPPELFTNRTLAEANSGIVADFIGRACIFTSVALGLFVLFSNGKHKRPILHQLCKDVHGAEPEE